MSDWSLSRRTFLKATGALGAVGAVGAGRHVLLHNGRGARAQDAPPVEETI